MDTTTLESVQKLRKDLRLGTATLTPHQARFLVDNYYAMQDYRIQCDSQVRTASEANEPCEVTSWLAEQMRTLEREVSKALAVFAESKREGRWALSQHGIGPVITAGLLAHIDIEKASTAGQIWRFAGLDPTQKWEKGKKRPWNAKLKVLCWKIGESFKKTSNSPKSFYGKLYRERKELEVSRSESGGCTETARTTLAEKKITDAATRAIYESGKLPAGRLDARATRYAVKFFLSHLHHVMYECKYDRIPPRPFVIEHMGHANVIVPPGWPCE